MSIERTYYCDGVDCERHSATIHPPPYLPVGAMEVREGGPEVERRTLHFCGWDCLLKYAATMPPEEIIPFTPPSDDEEPK